MAKLAIDGGKKVFETPIKYPNWPPRYPETAEKIKALYLNDRWSFYGPQEIEFNEKFAAFTGAKRCEAMVNGTVTLECALLALGVGPGDEVIVPAHTWMATGMAPIYCGATTVIADVDPLTLCLDPEKFEAAITPKTKAVIPVHLFGSMADMDKILAIARKHNIKVVEDCAHAHGGKWAGKHVGTLGDVGSFSFQESKLMASGEGGACITNDEKIAEALGRISHIGYQYGAKQGQSTPTPEGMVTHNYRMTEFQAIILLSQLEHLAEFTAERDAKAARFRARLEAIPGITPQAKGRLADPQSYYMMGFMVDHTHLKPGIDRDQVLRALQAEGALGLGKGWPNVMYKQNGFTPPKSAYRVDSSETAERIVCNQLLCAGMAVFSQDDKTLEGLADCVEKVMGEYYCK